MPKRILIISTLDTKRQETQYLRDKIASLGRQTVLMDISMGGDGAMAADISASRVAEAGGSPWDEIQRSTQRSKITAVMIAGAVALAQKLNQEQGLDGVIGLGGSTGSLMATEVMRALPFGIPKCMVSSTAALPGLATRYIGTGDIALFHSVFEISGISNLLRNVLDRAAHAISAMAEDGITTALSRETKTIAMTMLGPCEKCAQGVRAALEKAGMQVIGFSAAGIGDRAMESMIASGFFDAVVDLAPGGVGEHLFGFMRDAGANRLESAGRRGIPQVISTCSVNHMTPAKSKYKPEYHERRKYDLDRYRTWLRMAPEEMEAVAEVFAKKLNKAQGPVKVVIPLQGWSGVDAPGNPTFDPEEDRVFINALKKRLDERIEIIEVDANMEVPEFASAVVDEALKIF